MRIHQQRGTARILQRGPIDNDQAAQPRAYLGRWEGTRRTYLVDLGAGSFTQNPSLPFNLVRLRRSRIAPHSLDKDIQVVLFRWFKEGGVENVVTTYVRERRGGLIVLLG